MKLLLCLKCSDIFSLRVQQERVCNCGLSGGQYTDRINATYWGESVLLGFSNPTLVTALRSQLAQGDLASGKGWRFEAFIIPRGATTAKKTEKPS